MTNYMVFVGKSVEKALEQASQELSRDVAQLQYDVVSYGSSGIFGLVGAKKAKIRVKVSEPNDADSAAPFQSEAKQEARNLVEDAFQLGSPGSDAKEPKIENAVSANLPQPVDAASPAANIGRAALQIIIDAITEGASITVEGDNDRLLFNVEGGNSALLIGKRGQTLEAIQYLVEKIVNKQANTRIRVLVDVKGYLGTRKAGLKKLAQRMAEKAQTSNKPVTVGQMNAYDRRVVHMTLKDNPEVRTQSMGEGYYRKLVIFPKRRKGKKGQSPSE